MDGEHTNRFYGEQRWTVRSRGPPRWNMDLYMNPQMAASRDDQIYVFPYNDFTQWAAEGETYGEESLNVNAVLDMLGVGEAFALRAASRRFARFLGGTTRWVLDDAVRVLTHALRAGRFHQESFGHTTTNELAVLRTIIAYTRIILGPGRLHRYYLHRHYYLHRPPSSPSSPELLRCSIPQDEADDTQ